ncbi:hypothetical protein L4X63_10265 [Geomonas sp. Red32]|uniref:hypothetical protein n=1 Tax=Geomonas sp. Red32 TaxID=2912856 RepID=UPI00202D01C1|nr:hypothetical protein [Geomonas sp. Red32]MCM0081975.1 hypothetical protein [Geomonas sp. Red32]
MMMAVIALAVVMVAAALRVSAVAWAGQSRLVPGTMPGAGSSEEELIPPRKVTMSGRQHNKGGESCSTPW